MKDASVSSEADSFKEKEVKIKVSYLELYNENINDLLDSNNKNLDIRENRQKGIYVDKLTEYEVESFQQTMDYLH